jgi:hypothetical protein
MRDALLRKGITARVSCTRKLSAALHAIIYLHLFPDTCVTQVK